MNYLSAEWKKLPKWQILGIGLIFLTLASFIGLGIYFANQSVLIDGTQSKVLWGQLTFYYSQVLLAPMLGIFAGLSLLPEFERKTLDMLKANAVSIPRLVFGKIFSLVAMALPIQGLLLVVFFIAAHIAHISLGADRLMYVEWVGLSLITFVPIYVFQFFLLARSKSFSKSVGVAAIGVMLGFVLLFINENLSQFYVYSLPMVALRSRALESPSLLDVFRLIGASLFYTLLFFYLTYRQLKKSH